MKKILKALGITIALTAIGVAMRAIIRSEISKEKLAVKQNLDALSKTIELSRLKR